MKSGELLLAGIAVAALLVIPADIMYTSRFVPRFKEIEKERIVISNQLATAKIVSENLNHVRDLVFHNMDFEGQPDTASQESLVFDFITSCVNDLKMKLIAVRPSRPTIQGRITTIGYDIHLEGDFFSFGELCSKLENSRRVMALTSFVVAKRESGSGHAGNGGSAKAGSVPMPTSGRRGVSIKLYLETYRVKKG